MTALPCFSSNLSEIVCSLPSLSGAVTVASKLVSSCCLLDGDSVPAEIVASVVPEPVILPTFVFGAPGCAAMS